jgi:hypothetical protein
MPAEIFDEERFIQLSVNAENCRIKRNKDVVKLKMRTPMKLYTLKIEPSRTEALTRRLRCEIVEI